MIDRGVCGGWKLKGWARGECAETWIGWWGSDIKGRVAIELLSDIVDVFIDLPARLHFGDCQLAIKFFYTKRPIYIHQTTCNIQAKKPQKVAMPPLFSPDPQLLRTFTSSFF